MNKYIIGIDGMRCGMCEMHVKDAIRKAIALNRVKASRIKHNVIVFTELHLTKEDFIYFLSETGYRVASFDSVEAVHKWYGWR